MIDPKSAEIRKRGEGMKNKIYITNEEEDISIEMLLDSDSATGGEQLIVRSVKALIRTLSLQEYAKYGKNARNRFDSDLEAIARTVHDVAVRSGWSELQYKADAAEPSGSAAVFHIITTRQWLPSCMKSISLCGT